jgi:hypothetical protein
MSIISIIYWVDLEEQKLCFLASIWVVNNLPGIVISAKNLGLKFRSYIAGLFI